MTMESRYRWTPAAARPAPSPDRKLLKTLIRRAAELAGLPVERDWLAAVYFIDDRAMARANAEYVGHQGPTDVITFSYFDDPESLVPGDVAVELLICLDVAAKETFFGSAGAHVLRLPLYTTVLIRLKKRADRA